jgi:hypothetical protein
MALRRALGILLLLVAVVFAASFAVARAVRDEPEPSGPPPAVVAPRLPLAHLGPPAQLPALRPQPSPSNPAAEE